VWPHKRQPTRLPRPWDSLGKNTGVGCHFLLQCMKVKSESEVAQSCPTFRDPMDCSPPGPSVHGIFQARVLEWCVARTSEPKGLDLRCNSRNQSSKKSDSSKWMYLVLLLRLSRFSQSDSVRPHGLQPTRLLRPWDFPGKSTGVGCHCLLRMHLVAVLKSYSGFSLIFLVKWVFVSWERITFIQPCWVKL